MMTNYIKTKYVKLVHIRKITSISNKILLLAFVWCIAWSNVLQKTVASVDDNSLTFSPLGFNFQCSDNVQALKKDTNSLLSPHVVLQVSDHAIHQIITRIFAIILREKLNYRNVSIIEYKYDKNTNSEHFEEEKLYYTLQLIRNLSAMTNLPMINLAVWMPSISHQIKPSQVHEGGSSITVGRYGWFVPHQSNKKRSLNSTYPKYLHYSIFLNYTNENYKQFVVDDDILNRLQKDTNNTIRFISPLCEKRSCVTLLAQYRYDTSFVEWQIKEMKAYLNILWLGDEFTNKVTWLNDFYGTNFKSKRKNFVVLHWTPSDIIDAQIKFQSIEMPRCEELISLQNSTCKYELTPILKYFSRNLFHKSNERILQTLRSFFLSDDALQDLQKDFNKLIVAHNHTRRIIKQIYNNVSCNWIQSNGNVYRRWISEEFVNTLYIGGIFPKSETNRGHQNLDIAVERAVKAINNNKTLLRNYNLTVLENDGQCKADMVMKAFIHYFNEPHMLGVLGPACSETVEPIAGISKHMNMAVISYSAEGATFIDREAYPFFFRTIGSNRQYEDAYISLMQHFGWRRIAALTEDGQKYTDYISHMEASMKEHNLELIINKKFLSDVTNSEMNKHLLDLKRRRAKIIIADIHTRNVEIALCEALKLDMTTQNGYVWFLPSWISKNWEALNRTSNNNCSNKDLLYAFDGHFSIMHTPFGYLNNTMQENITIQEWLKTFSRNNKTVSDYAGFVYDAVWTYALAADKLFRENGDALTKLRSKEVVNRFTKLIWETDFEGVSGRVRFGLGGSRITHLNIMQWKRFQLVKVGTFYPSIIGNNSKLYIKGGRLELYESSMQIPGDGTYDCDFSTLVEIFGADCNNATMIFTAIVCFFVVILVSLISFLFWKRRYDGKLKRSAKILKNFGIDLLSPSRSNSNTLDKWEIPKENIVINRRIGKGAFGTVYGGEAQLKSAGWIAVAVKTLKPGASIEDRLDFLSEAEAMKRFNHKNIIQLLGVCLQSEPIYTIMEFMLYGDLKTYLLARRHLVNEKNTDDSDISAKRLTMYVLDVARGLSYLAQQKYVHRDIACRNCLVNAQRVVKLGDFGMARPTYENDYYRFNRKGMLPVRWMAPESLALGMFTPSSDVWAFGVVLYEIITFGSFPYQGLTNIQVLEYVKSGNTLEIPSGIKPHLEGLIKACWNKESKKRPTASEIVEYISSYPRLITPCLDFPIASVEMPKSDSDEIELIPKMQKCLNNNRNTTLDILDQTSNKNQFDNCNKTSENIGLSDHSQQPSSHPSKPSIILDSFPLLTQDGYSIMSPLLMHQISECSDSSQARLLKQTSIEGLQQTPF